MKKIKYVVLVLVLVFFDQISKWLMLDYSLGIEGLYIPLTNFLRFTYVENHGGIFGIFQGHIYVFTVISIILISYLIYTEKNTIKNFNYLQNIALCFLIAGASGNMIDRLFRGYVIDMIDFYLIWPFIFNLADTFIHISVILFVISYILKKVKK